MPGTWLMIKENGKPTNYPFMHSEEEIDNLAYNSPRNKTYTFQNAITREIKRVKGRNKGLKQPVMPSKFQNEKSHAKTRFKERYNKDLNSGDYNECIQKIQNNQAEFLRRQCNRATIWRLKVAGQTAIAVYDNNRHAIVTFLTEEMEK